MISVIAGTLVFLGYHAINILIAEWNAAIVVRRIRNGNPKQIEHFWWGLGYVILCLPQYWIFNVWFVVAILIPHLSVFAPAYNRFRGLPAFYLSKTSKSLTDKLMVRIGLKDTEAVCFFGEFIALVLLTISIINS